MSPAALFAAGRFAQARQAYEKEIAREPGNAEPRVGLLRTLLRLDDWTHALLAGESAAKQVPANADLDGIMSVAEMRAGDIDAATAWSAKATAVDAHSFWALIAAGGLNLWDNKQPQARALFEEAAERYPDEPDGSGGVMATYDQQSQFGPEYLQALKEFVRLNPKGLPFDLTIDQCRDQLRDYDAYWSYFTTHPPLAREPGGSAPASTTVPFDLASGWVVVPVTIDGQTFHMVFDSGAAGIVLSKGSAARLKLPVLGHEAQLGVQGQETFNCLRAGKMTVGGFTFDTIPILASESTSGFGDGILGAGALDRYVISIDYESKTLTLSDKTPDPAASAVQAQTLTVPFHYLTGLIIVPARVGKQPSASDRRVWGVLDTGSEYSLLSLRMARIQAAGLPKSDVAEQTVTQKVGVGESSRGIKFIALRQPLYLGTGSTKRQVGGIFPITLGASPLDQILSPGLGLQVDALLGEPFATLCRKITIDYPDDTVSIVSEPYHSAPAKPVGGPNPVPK